MQQLEKIDYLKLREAAHVIEADQYGDKVLQLTDGSFLKLFRRKRLLTSAAFYPYAQRFADNASQLQRRHIQTPTIIEVYRVAAIERDIVHYSPLPGQTIRQLFNNDEPEKLKTELGRFVALLHEQGVYFRSLHLGNIVQTPEYELGLIDIADLRCQSRPLSQRLRLRNFNHLLRYENDRIWLMTDDGRAFFNAYLIHSSIAFTRKTLRHQLNLPRGFFQ
ncbi:lipopolysaccharide kinase InaA family protein [Pseudomonas sp.]|uniref:lipopolysaccharide kinase InaA family protein n=1 Tax=Pseudomonas sp. TaxID=306 RepID=UPI0003103CCA|nr:MULTISPECIES: lipopolysaccharide kinase InaA family protein [Pseudomonas]